jgi:hypothetical protein
MIIKRPQIDEGLPVAEIAKQLTARLDADDNPTREWVEYYKECRGRPLFMIRRECSGVIGFIFADESDAEPAMLAERFPQLTEAEAAEIIRIFADGSDAEPAMLAEGFPQLTEAEAAEMIRIVRS